MIHAMNWSGLRLIDSKTRKGEQMERRKGTLANGYLTIKDYLRCTSIFFLLIPISICSGLSKILNYIINPIDWIQNKLVEKLLIILDKKKDAFFEKITKYVNNKRNLKKLDR